MRKELTEDEKKAIAEKDIQFARKRGIRNAIITAAGVAVFAGVIIATGLTWGWSLPVISFAASWGLLGAGVTWGVGFWANSKNRWLKKLQREKQIKETGQVQTRKGPQNVQTQAVAKNNQKLEKHLNKFENTRMAKRNSAYMDIFRGTNAVDAETATAKAEMKDITTREDGLNYLKANIDSTILPSTDDLSKLEGVKVDDGYMGVMSEDLISGSISKISKVAYKDEYSKETGYLRTLGLLKDAPDLCFPITIAQYTNKAGEGEAAKYTRGFTITINDADEAEKLFTAQAEAVEKYAKAHAKAKTEEATAAAA